MIYYFKNINSLTLESTNFSLNDEEFSKIKEISNNVDNEVLILFWQFTIKTLEELDIISNQSFSIEMYLMRLMYLTSSKDKNDDLKKKDFSFSIEKNQDNNKDTLNFKNDTINQIKNITQEKKTKPQLEKKIKIEGKNEINSFKQLLDICFEKKEMKLKYELENNVNLVNFDKNRIEISFNDNLDKNFVKDLSSKLFEWTNERWIITFSKTKGEISIKSKEKNNKIEVIKNIKNSKIYKDVLEKFPDANLIDVVQKQMIKIK